MDIIQVSMDFYRYPRMIGRYSWLPWLYYYRYLFNKRRQHIAYSVFRFIPTCFAYSFIRVYDIDTHNNLVLLSLMRNDVSQ